MSRGRVVSGCSLIILSQDRLIKTNSNYIREEGYLYGMQLHFFFHTMEVGSSNNAMALVGLENLIDGLMGEDIVVAFVEIFAEDVLVVTFQLFLN